MSSRKPHTSMQKTSSARISSQPAHLQSSTQQPAHVLPSPHPGPSDGHCEFPRKLFNVLENGTLAVWIYWHQDEGLFIPNVKDFVNHALHRCFPKMKGWDSFQRQMSNYDFVKRDWNKSRAHYVHRDNKLCRGRPDLVSEIRRRPKNSTYQDSVQEQPPASNTPAVLEPPSQLNPDARVELLPNRLAELERRLEAAEVEAAKVPELERRLEVAELELAKVAELERQLRKMDTLIKEVLSPRGAGLSPMTGPPNTQAGTEPVEEADSNQYLMASGAVSNMYLMDEGAVSNMSLMDEGVVSNIYLMASGAVSNMSLMDEGADTNQYAMDGAGHSSGDHDKFAPESSIGAYVGAEKLRDVSSHMGPKPTISLPDLELDGHAGIPNNTPRFASSSHPLRHATGLPVVEVFPSTQGIMMDEQGAGASAGAQTSSTLGPQRPVYSVPERPSPPASFWTEFLQAIGQATSSEDTRGQEELEPNW